MKNVFIIGSKGIPAKYGGFETFVDRLTEISRNRELRYHIACLSKNNNNEYRYNNARCFNVKVKDIKNVKAIIYDLKALKESIKYIEKYNFRDSIIYILTSRIGPFVNFYKKKFKKLNIKLFFNPDGLEWKRRKWNKFVRIYWRLSEKLMVKNADLVICDSMEIRKYILSSYYNSDCKIKYIPYGADINKSRLKSNDQKILKWFKKNNIKANNYYLMVGRLVPENNHEIIIKEFIKAKSDKDLIIISGIDNYYFKLSKRIGLNKKSRIKFVGSVYDRDLLKKIRENAFAYIHGHEVGGTNPSLLESLASTKINLVLNTPFNKEVAKESALYFNKNYNSLKSLINKTEGFKIKEIKDLNEKAMSRIKKFYLWGGVVKKYEKLFLK